MEVIINTVLSHMQPLLDAFQLKQLKATMRAAFERAKTPSVQDPADLLELFLTTKGIEGCSPKTITYYRTTLAHMTQALAKPYTQVAREVFSDEDLVGLRDSRVCARDLAIVDALASTGMRVGELVDLDIVGVDLERRECIITGKGNKQRPVYLDTRAKLHLEQYLAHHDDANPALFVSLDRRAARMSTGNVEGRMCELGRTAGVGRVHPHKFRRTLATRAIDKGMPVE